MTSRLNQNSGSSRPVSLTSSPSCVCTLIGSDAAMSLKDINNPGVVVGSCTAVASNEDGGIVGTGLLNG
jgi:hypothetical protein